MLKRDKTKVGALPKGEVTIAYGMRTPPGRGVPAELKFWINGKEAATGTVRSTVDTVPAGFTVTETFDVGMDLNSPVADAYYEKAPFEFEGRLARPHFEDLAPRAATPAVPDD